MLRAKRGVTKKRSVTFGSGNAPYCSGCSAYHLNGTNLEIKDMKINSIAGICVGLMLLATSACTDNPTTNAVTGAVVGGLVGNQFGGGKGKVVTTVVGAGAGAAIGANATK